MNSNYLFHHFKGNKLSRAEKIQRLIIRKIFNSKIPNPKREESIEWELMHISSSIQIARLLAEKRKLDPEYAVVIAALHDVSAVMTGSYKNHAIKGSKIAERILKKSKDFTFKEIKLITQAIEHHSEKHIYSKKPYIELAKDFDVFDCFLYDKDIYDGGKKPEILIHYYKRLIKIRKELSLPKKNYFFRKLKLLKKQVRK